MDDESVDFLSKTNLENITANKRLICEQESLYLMPTWDMTRSITLKYLKSFEGPCAVIKSLYNTSS